MVAHQCFHGLGAIELARTLRRSRAGSHDHDSRMRSRCDSLRLSTTFTSTIPSVPTSLCSRIDAARGSREQVALVGTSGAGKSTVASLLLRFHEPDQGELLVGDLPASGMDLRGYRQQVAFALREVILWGHLRANIRYGRPGRH